MNGPAANVQVPVAGERPAGWRGYATVAVLSAAVGGLCVAFATRAVPRMASGIASGVMAGMMARMQEAGCDPGAT